MKKTRLGLLNTDIISEHQGARTALVRLARGTIVRELLIVFTFFLLTAAMTWPWVTSMRDAIADEGDPYMIAWSLWWNYHQTFSDPLNLFHANVFYPYKYTLAFSEHEYGIALLFFPLFALGLRPLTVHAVATFCGFAFSGYAQFRLTRTLTRSARAAWIAGIIFAFIPYRFQLMAHLHYLFAGWIPLLLEAVVLFASKRTWRRAAWLGVAFVMNALTCTSYFILTLVPLALSLGLLVLRYQIERDRAFWLRGGAALGLALLVLLPFMLPYYFVMKLYGFVRSANEVADNSPTPLSWLVAGNRNRLWKGLGDGISGTRKEGLFPGLLPLLLSLPGFVWPPRGSESGQLAKSVNKPSSPGVSLRPFVILLDVAALAALVAALLGAGYQGMPAHPFGVEIFRVLNPTRAIFVFTVALLIRLSLAYPRVWQRTDRKNLIDSLRSARRGVAFALGLIWTLCGFFGSLGMNFFVNRVLYDFVPLFKAIRVPSHWAMVAFTGLALLAGLGTERLAQHFVDWWPRVRHKSSYVVIGVSRPRAAVFVVIAVALLFELRAAPLRFLHGKVLPDQISLRLKQTPMRGGLVELPHDLGMALPHRYMLRSADHQKPLVNGTSSFISPVTDQIAKMTSASPLDVRLLDLLESIPASYLVIHASLLLPERRVDYETFLTEGMRSNRLRFVRSYGDRDDLYAVVKTEPAARSEAPPPFVLKVTEWEALIKEDTVNILGQYREWSQAVYRFYIASYDRIPSYAEFLPDVESIGRGVFVGDAQEQSKLEVNLRDFAEAWSERAKFKALYKDMNHERYVDTLLTNAGVPLGAEERAALLDKLSSGAMTRAQVLLELVNMKEFKKKEDIRSLVLLHYFGYLQRNPGDAPDYNLDGFNYWVKELEVSGDKSRLGRAFMASGEYQHREK